MKKVLLFALALFILSLGNAFAYSFPLFNGTALDPGTKFEDTDIDFFMDMDGNGIISVDDVLYSAIEFDYVVDQTVDPPVQYTLDNSLDTLVAWSTIQVASIDGDGGSGTEIFFQQYQDIPMVQVYSGGSIDFNPEGDYTLLDAENAIKTGADYLWAFSLDPNDDDTFWRFVATIDGTLDPSIVNQISDAQGIGQLNFALNQVYGDDIFEPIFSSLSFLYGTNGGDDFLVDMLGTGPLLGGGNQLLDGFARSDIDVEVNPIPEPSTLLLLGAGFMGLAFTLRKRNRNS